MPDRSLLAVQVCESLADSRTQQREVARATAPKIMGEVFEILEKLGAMLNDAYDPAPVPLELRSPYNAISKPHHPARHGRVVADGDALALHLVDGFLHEVEAV